MFMDYSFMIYLTCWRCISMCSKRLIYFNVPTCSSRSLCLLLPSYYFMFLFQLLFALWYARLKLSYKFLQILIRGTGVADYYNIILLRLNLEVHIFHCSRGGRLAALVGVCIVWKLEPLASGGQSIPKLIPHIICQFLYAWEKNSERGLILQGIKCQPAPFWDKTSFWDKTPFWDKSKFFASHFIQCSKIKAFKIQRRDNFFQKSLKKIFWLIDSLYLQHRYIMLYL